MGHFAKYGWARCGGELAPRVPTPWPQDYIISQGKSTKVYYDDLSLFEWTQGVLSIIEAEDNLATMRYMMAHNRSLFRDAETHGFEAIKWDCVVL
jgi:hypothetical protein